MALVVGSQRQGSLNPPLGAVVVKIDRASVLGNPFDMRNNEALRQPVTEAHQVWLEVVLEQGRRIDAVRLAVDMAAELELTIAPSWKRPSSKAVIEELFRIEQLPQTHEVWIMCWCAPKACHGDAYKNAIESGRVAAVYKKRT